MITLRVSKNKLSKHFHHKKADYKSVTVRNKTISYLYLESPKKVNTTIVFIHGAPGSSKDFLQYLKDDELLGKANLLAVDRPGYGYSDFARAESSVAFQASLIVSAISPQIKEHHILLLGHSYGGTIACRIAMDYPKLAGQMILLAPAVSPQHEKTIWLAFLAKYYPFKWIIPAVFCVAATEKLSHRGELLKMLPLWKKIQIPVTNVHAKRDSIVPYQNHIFISEQLRHTDFQAISLKKGNHFIPWQNYKLVKKLLNEAIEKA